MFIERMDKYVRYGNASARRSYTHELTSTDISTMANHLFLPTGVRAAPVSSSSLHNR